MFCRRRFSEPFCMKIVRTWTPRNHQTQGFHMERIQNPWFSRFQQFSYKKCSPWNARSSQNGCQMNSRSGPEAPGVAQDVPKSSQERPKSAQGAPQESPGAAQEAQETPRAPQERPKSHFGVNLEPPGPHLEAFSEPLGLNFRTFHAFNATIALAACLLTRLPAAPASMPSKVPWVGGCPR